MGCRKASIVVLACVMLIAPALLADVKTESKTKVEFPGLLGGIVKTFGGKSAREGIVSKTALKGDRKMTVNEDTAELVDLKEEKIYQIDMKKKTYTVLTFEEMRRQMQEAMDKAKQQAGANPGGTPKAQQPAQGQEPQFAMDFKLQESGQKKTINGYDCHEVVATITVRQKDKPTDEGAMVITSNMWLAPRIAAMKELEEFDRRLAEKLYLPFAQEMAAQITPAMGMYPGLKEAMGKLEVEKVNMDGTTVLTVIKGDFLGNPNQTTEAKPAEQNKQTEIPKSLGGLLGGLGKRAATRKDDNADKEKSASFMTTTDELLSVSTTVSDSDVSIPAGFKEKK